MSDTTTFKIEEAVFEIGYFIEPAQKAYHDQEGYDACLCVENVFHKGEEMPAFICEHISDNYNNEIMKSIEEEELL